MKCYLCESEKIVSVLSSPTRDKKNIFPIKCLDCGLIFLSNLNEIKEDLYYDGGMWESEKDDQPSIENLFKETKNYNDRRIKFLKNLLLNKKLLDFGCGHGGFLFEAKKYCSDVCGCDIEKRMISFLKDNDIRVEKSLSAYGKEKFDLITLFHSLEHFLDPVEKLKSMKPFLEDRGKIIIEIPSLDDPLIKLYNSDSFQNFYYWSFHLFYFNDTTLKKVVEKAGYRVDFVRHEQRYGLGNHLYWLSKNKPNGHNEFFFLDEKKINKLYKKMLREYGYYDTILCGISCNS